MGSNKRIRNSELAFLDLPRCLSHRESKTIRMIPVGNKEGLFSGVDNRCCENLVQGSLAPDLYLYLNKVVLIKDRLSIALQSPDGIS